jgi:hypothetical protein
MRSVRIEHLDLLTGGESRQKRCELIVLGGSPAVLV